MWFTSNSCHFLLYVNEALDAFSTFGILFLERTN